MGVPVLTTDFWSKPEPTGSINGTVARIMAQAGAVIGERVEKQQATNEAKMMAPLISAGYAGAYKKIASGDMSGFADMAGVKSLGAGNPLLAAMAKDADNLGIHLANNVTQQRTLESRLASQQQMQGQRIGAQVAAREDTQAFKSQQDIDKENLRRQKLNDQSNAAADEEAKITGKRPPVQLLPLVTGGGGSGAMLPSTDGAQLPQGASGGVVSADGPVADGDPRNALGMGEQQQASQAAPAQQGGEMVGGGTVPPNTPGVERGPNPSGSTDYSLPSRVATPQTQKSGADFTKLMDDPATEKIMDKYGIVPSDFQNLQVEGETVSLTREGQEPIKLSPEDSKALVGKFAEITGPLYEDSSVGKTVPNNPATQSADPVQVKSDGKNLDEMEFGSVKVRVGQPSASEKMKLRSVTITNPTGSKTFADPSFTEGKDDSMKARTTFIESIGVMKTDPKASDFIIQNWGSTKDPRIGFEEVKDSKSGKTTMYRMYGIGNDGKRIAYDSGSADAPYKDIVSEDFQKAYKGMLQTKDVVNSKYGIQLERPKEEEKKAAASPWDKLADPEIATVAKQAYSDFKEGKITEQERNNRVLLAQSKKEERKLHDDSYGTMEELDAAVEREKNPQKPKVDRVKDLKSKLKDVESQLKGGTETGPPAMASGMYNPTMMGGQKYQMSATKKRQLVIMRSNLMKQIEELSN